MMNDVRTDAHVSVISETLFSRFLNRDVLVDVYLPPTYYNNSEVNLLLINDGQDLPLMPFSDILSNLYNTDAIEPLLCVGIHCGTDRKNEYGTIIQKNYKGQGAKAKEYTDFVMLELLPFIKKQVSELFVQKQIVCRLFVRRFECDGHCAQSSKRFCKCRLF